VGIGMSYLVVKAKSENRESALLYGHSYQPQAFDAKRILYGQHAIAKAIHDLVLDRLELLDRCGREEGR